MLAQTHIYRSRLVARAAAGPRAGQDGHSATASCDTAGTSRNPKRNEILEVRTRQASAPLTAKGYGQADNRDGNLAELLPRRLRAPMQTTGALINGASAMPVRNESFAQGHG